MAPLEELPQLFLASAKIFRIGLHSRFGRAAIRGGQSIPGPLATDVAKCLVSDMRLRGCRVVEKGIAVNHNILHDHR